MTKVSLILIAGVTLGGCATTVPVAPRPPLTVVDPVAPWAPDEGTIKALAAAQTAVLAAQALRPDWGVGAALLERADQALETGDGATVRLYARQAAREAEGIARTHFVDRSARLINQAREFARLAPDQQGRLRKAELEAARGNYRTASDMLGPMVIELYAAARTHVVAPGESLWRIAGREDVYANELLWPLLFRDNKGLIRRPESIEAGWPLRIRLHPRREEIFAAAAFAQARMAGDDPAALDRAWLMAK